MPCQTNESVVDRHRPDADPDPDPNFPVDADPDPDPDWNQIDTDPHADPTPSFTPLRKSEYFFYTAMSVCNVLSFSSVSNVQ